MSAEISSDLTSSSIRFTYKGEYLNEDEGYGYDFNNSNQNLFIPRIGEKVGFNGNIKEVQDVTYDYSKTSVLIHVFLKDIEK